jgi:hypothetical protein
VVAAFLAFALLTACTDGELRLRSRDGTIASADSGAADPPEDAGDGGGAVVGTGASMTTLVATPASHVAAVVRVSWEAPVPTTGFVVATDGDGAQWTSPTSALALAHDLAFFGLPMGEDYALVLHAEDDEGGTWSSEPVVFSSPSLPSSSPTLSLSVDATDRVAGYHAFPVVQSTADPSSYPIVIVDDDGRVVWATQNPGGELCTAVRFSRDGRRLLANFGSGVVSHPLDGSAPTTFPRQGAHHDFIELPNGNIAMIVEDERVLDGVTYTSDAVYEIDERGRKTELWNLWDRLDELGLTIGGGVDWDETDIAHANALAYDEASDELVIGLPAMQATVRFSVDTGDARWIVGPDGGVQFSLPGLDTWQLQHQIALTDDGYYIFVNRIRDEDCSLVYRVQLDEESRTATAVDHFGEDTCYSTFALGGLGWVDDDVLGVSWSASGMLEQRRTDGEVLWALGAPLGSAFGYADFRATLNP